MDPEGKRSDFSDVVSTSDLDSGIENAGNSISERGAKRLRSDDPVEFSRVIEDNSGLSHLLAQARSNVVSQNFKYAWEEDCAYSRIFSPKPFGRDLTKSRGLGIYRDTIEESTATSSGSSKTIVRFGRVKNFENAVKSLPEKTWLQTRTELKESLCNKWLTWILDNVPFSDCGKQLARMLGDGHGEVDMQQTVIDIFKRKSPLTLRKRLKGIQRLGTLHVSSTGFHIDSLDEESLYRCMCKFRADGGLASARQDMVEALKFCGHLLGIPSFVRACSPRVFGTLTPDRVKGQRKSSLLRVSEVVYLEKTVFEDDLWDAVFAGFILFLLYSRCRHSDVQASLELNDDRDDEGVLHFLESQSLEFKTQEAKQFRGEALPIVAVAAGISRDWGEEWLKKRKMLNLEIGKLSGPIMPAPNASGNITCRPLSTEETTAWLRLLLNQGGFNVGDRNKMPSAHSMKSTALSWCSKFGLDENTRAILGAHSLSRFAVIFTYSRDTLARPLIEFAKVVSAIRIGSFLPDSTRSGRVVGEESRVPLVVPEVPADTSNTEEPAVKGDHSMADEAVDLRMASDDPSIWEQLESGLSLSGFELESESGQQQPVDEEFEDFIAVESDGNSSETSNERSSDSSIDYSGSCVFPKPEPVPVGYTLVKNKRTGVRHLVEDKFPSGTHCGRPVKSRFVKEDIQMIYASAKCQICFKQFKGHA